MNVTLTQFEDKKLVTLPLDDLLELMEDHHFLYLLYENGLEDWEGFSYALDTFRELKILPPDNATLN